MKDKTWYEETKEEFIRNINNKHTLDLALKTLEERQSLLNGILKKEESQEQSEVIDKAIELIKYNEKYRDGANCCQFVDIVSEILDPLQSILEQDEMSNNAYLKEFEDWLKEVSE